MKEYHKIQTVFLRDPGTNYKTLLFGQFALPEFEYLADNEWVFTEKVDGTNTRIIVDGNGNVAFAGKTSIDQMRPQLVSALSAEFSPLVIQLGDMFPKGACLYGEGYGAKVQKGGGNYRPDQGFVLFDVRVGDWWLMRQDVEEIAADLGIDVVPIIGTGTLWNMVEIAHNGFLSQWGNFAAEGIVARPKTELKTRSGERIITKIKYRDFTGRKVQ